MINKTKLGKTVAWHNNSNSTAPSGAIVLFGRMPGICVNPVYPYQMGVLDISGAEYCFAVPALTEDLEFGTAVYVPTASNFCTGNDFTYRAGQTKTQIGRISKKAKCGDVKIYVTTKYAEGGVNQGGGGEGEPNVIEIVKVNNAALPVDGNKSVNIDLADYATTDDLHGYATTGNLSSHTGDTSVHVSASEKATWNAKYDLPSGGSDGQILTKTSSGTAWQDAQGGVGPAGPQGEQGPAGADGFSPTATVQKSGTTTTISITDRNGTTTADILDGAAGGDPDITTCSGSSITISPSDYKRIEVPGNSTLAISAGTWDIDKYQKAKLVIKLHTNSVVTVTGFTQVGELAQNGIYICEFKGLRVPLHSDGGPELSKPYMICTKVEDVAPDETPRDGLTFQTAYHLNTDKAVGAYTIDSTGLKVTWIQRNAYIKFKAQSLTYTIVENPDANSDTYIYNENGTQVARLNDGSSYTLSLGATYYMKSGSIYGYVTAQFNKATDTTV